MDILGECSGKSFLTADFLAANEGVNGDGDGAVDILRGAVIRQAHLAECFGNTHDGFQVADLVDVRVWVTCG